MDLCPVCGEKYVRRCKCPRSDSECSNGHSWHRCVKHGRIVMGRSDHGLPADACTCKKGETTSGQL